jgi:EAL domain-containing protein (putative c-di-GMP-specific phosphodiesterase class I)
MRITAEGLETVQQLAVLQALGCDIGQGYLLGKPAPPSEVGDTWLSSPVIDGAGRGSAPLQKRVMRA